MEKRDLSWIVYTLLILIIFRHIVEIIKNLINIPLAIDSSTIIMNICVGVVMIVSLALILNKKALGVYLFICLQLFSAVYNSFVTGDAFIHIGVAVFMCVFMFLILQIREKGVSAWSIIFKKKNKSILRETKETDNIESKNDDTSIDTISEKQEMSVDRMSLNVISEVVRETNTDEKEDIQSLESKTRCAIPNLSFISWLKRTIVGQIKNVYFLWFVAIILIFCGIWYLFVQEKHLGNKVYLDYVKDEAILHADRKCKYLKSAEYIDTAQLNICFDLYCTECISNTIAEEIDSVIERNQIKLNQQKEKENIKKVSVLEESHFRIERTNLYNYLCKEYDMGSFDDYLVQLDSQQKRRKLYDEVLKHKLPLLSYEVYEAMLGYGKYKSLYWIYSVLNKKNYYAGTFEDFKASLIVEDDRDMYFEKLNICIGNIVSKEHFNSLISIKD